MDFQKLLENKPLLYGIIGGLVLVLALFITIGVVASSKSKDKNGEQTVTEQPLKTDVDLLTTDNLGKAIEIQALLARYNIAVSRSLDGTK